VGRYPLLVMIVLLGLSYLVDVFLPVSFGLAWIQWLGVALLLCGVSLLLAAAGLFRLRGTTVDPTKSPNKLVTDGIYRVSRNPMYLGMVWILLGISLFLDSLVGLVFPVGFYVYMNWRVIPREEMTVESVFGEEFRDYKRRTRRWI
jgi:protein-S-isoprenylcysteine O-methyltransferase Ste14